MKTNLLFFYFQQGGPFMYPLFLFLFGALFFIIERLLVFTQFNWKTRYQISDLNQNYTIKKQNRFTLILKSNLKYFYNNGEKFNQMMEVDMQNIINYLEKNLNYLTAIATLAPITGFLGTVSGMIIAFKDITNAADVTPQLVAGGIYEALITTATGLLITIFTSFFYFLFTGKIKKYITNLELTVNEIYKAIETGKLQDYEN
ncbi:MAG: MotA/TolQ/ExbB proton channel family protein [Spirochaetes bacterium]|nr:MotA/TolQ/ExbB proton channel family protein [Spirochaetota bacterium]